MISPNKVVYLCVLSIPDHPLCESTTGPNRPGTTRLYSHPGRKYPRSPEDELPIRVNCHARTLPRELCGLFPKGANTCQLSCTNPAREECGLCPKGANTCQQSYTHPVPYIMRTLPNTCRRSHLPTTDPAPVVPTSIMTYPGQVALSVLDYIACVR